MALTKLDDTCALIVIDLQKGITRLADRASLQRNYRTCSEARARIPRTRSAGCSCECCGPGSGPVPMPGCRHSRFRPIGPELVPELEQQPGDHLITKQRLGAFIGTSLDETLRHRGVTQVLLTGISTSAGVESSARSAYDLGYHVTLVADAMTDRDAEVHRHCIEKVFPRLGEVCTTNDVLKQLQARHSSGFNRVRLVRCLAAVSQPPR